MAASDYKQLATEIARRYGIDPAFFQSLIGAESSWNPRAKSPVGAMGLGQLMPGTAQRYNVADPWDPVQNLHGAAAYLSDLQREFKDKRLVAAAYNAGEGAVRKYKGEPPYPETQAYVERVMGGIDPRMASLDGGGPAVPPQSLPSRASLPPELLASALPTAPERRTPSLVDRMATNPWIQIGLGILASPQGTGSAASAIGKGILGGLQNAQAAQSLIEKSDATAQHNDLWRRQLTQEALRMLGGTQLSPVDSARSTAQTKVFQKPDGGTVTLYYDQTSNPPTFRRPGTGEAVDPNALGYTATSPGMAGQRATWGIIRGPQGDTPALINGAGEAQVPDGKGGMVPRPIAPNETVLPSSKAGTAATGAAEKPGAEYQVAADLGTEIKQLVTKNPWIPGWWTKKRDQVAAGARQIGTTLNDLGVPLGSWANAAGEVALSAEKKDALQQFKTKAGAYESKLRKFMSADKGSVMSEGDIQRLREALNMLGEMSTDQSVISSINTVEGILSRYGISPQEVYATPDSAPEKTWDDIQAAAKSRGTPPPDMSAPVPRADQLDGYTFGTPQ